MKKMIPVLLILLLTLSACNNEPDKYEGSINNNEFLIVKELASDSETKYYMDLYVDEENSKLFVTGEIVYFNYEENYTELDIKIYPNAYNLSGNEYNVNFEYLKINDTEYTVEYSGVDNTTIHLELEETLKKNETFRIKFKYDFTYWDNDRIANYNDYFITMFFYPFVALQDSTGELQTDPYTFKGESYYNNIGDYYVSITLPNTYKIAASGKVVEVIHGVDNDIYNMYLDNGRDFSFSASKNYHTYQKEINDIDYTIQANRPLTSLEQSNSFKWLEDSVRIFEDYIGEYPYDYFTLEYGYIYGMESTGVIYCSENINETTVVHEVIHQWLYSMIGNDQSNDSFIDESLTTFITGAYYYELYGRQGADGYFAYRNSFKEELTEHYSLYEGDDMLQKVNDYEDGYAYIIYYHGPTLYRYYLDEYLDGDFSKLKTFLNALYDEYYNNIVTVDQLLDLLEETTGVEETKEWFTYMLEGVGTLDRVPEE